MKPKDRRACMFVALTMGFAAVQCGCEAWRLLSFNAVMFAVSGFGAIGGLLMAALFFVMATDENQAGPARLTDLEKG